MHDSVHNNVSHLTCRVRPELRKDLIPICPIPTEGFLNGTVDDVHHGFCIDENCELAINEDTSQFSILFEVKPCAEDLPDRKAKWTI